LLSDAAESAINLVAAVLAFTVLLIAERPADDDHAYGHEKVEYFSSGAEGALILVAALAIIYEAVMRFLHPVELQQLSAGLGISVLASLINLAVSLAMLKVAKKTDSIVLEADAKHLMTDVWTSVGMVAALAVLLFVPEWKILDPLVAIAVALNIIKTGIELIVRSMQGLMDQSLPEHERRTIETSVHQLGGPMVQFTQLRTRKSGAKRFVEFNLLVPGDWSVQAAHALCDQIEEDIARQLNEASIWIHIEPYGQS
ncbi:MAG TPA: cation diffusion facilitator family transporter, partial [Pseudomonadales bacterium]|nr:cation diffusion facilitator family transporter [Pseudomonadales bacterium]